MGGGHRAEIIIRNTQRSDIAAVMSKLADRVWAEINISLAHINREKRKSWLCQHVEEAIAASTSCTATVDKKPVGILTWTKEEERWFTTSLVCQRGFQRDVLRPSRRYLDQIQDDLESNLVAYSTSKHPEIERWFRFLGYELEEQDALCRVFLRRWKTCSTDAHFEAARKRTG